MLTEAYDRRNQQQERHARTMARLFREIGNSVVILGMLTLVWVAVGFLGGINTPYLIGCKSQMSPCWWLRFGGSDRKVLLNDE